MARSFLAALALACRSGAPSAAEPGYPNRPVRILVPYGPGGVADTTMRILAQKLNERLGQTVRHRQPAPAPAGILSPPRPAPPRPPTATAWR